MPELPEVQTITSDIANHLKGYSVSSVFLTDFYNFYPSRKEIKRTIIKKTIKNAFRVGKNLVIELENNNYLGFHFAMTGRLLAYGSDENADVPYAKHIKLKLLLETPNTKSKNYYLYFIDPRTFGNVKLYSQKDLTDLKAKFGPDISSDIIEYEFLHKILRKRKTSIKNVLLDQKFISGFGNIYANEALFLAGIHPETPANMVSLGNFQKLVKCGTKIIKEAIQKRGSTLADKMYVDLFGNPGSYQNNFKVYSLKKCVNCGRDIIKSKISQRGSYYCPICQK